jgi:hypothetical protein
MSKFALLAQSACLLGQVLKHVSNHTLDQTLYDEESIQLDRTLHALIRACDSLPCDQATICYRYILTASLKADLI